MNRRAIVIGASIALTAPHGGWAAGDGVKSARIGVMSIGTVPETAVEPRWVAFFQSLAALGYTEGRNLTVERGFAAGKAERLDEFAVQMVRRKVDVIVVTGIREVQAARRATTTIPIVTIVAPDPVAAGLVASLARPGGNVTGLTFESSGAGQKYVELVKEAVPTATRLAVLASRAQASALEQDMRHAARAVHVELVPSPLVSGPKDLAAFFTRAKRDGAGAIIVPIDGVTIIHRRDIVLAAASHRMPALYAWRDFVDAGGLMSYGAVFTDLFRRAPTFVDRILRGAKAAALPMEEPATFEVVVNLKTAQALGLTLPPRLLARANEVIQ